ELYVAQPKEGQPDMDPRCLLRVKKGIFGLAGAPRSWWRKLRRGLISANLEDENGQTIHVMQSRLDPTVFRGLNKDGMLCSLVCVHADDLLVATESQALRRGVRGLFNVCEWRRVPVVFCGKNMERDPNGGFALDQSAFVEGRFEPVELEKSRKSKPDLECNSAEIADSRSASGSLGWPAREKRPDLSCAVSMAQRTRNKPAVQNALGLNAAINVVQETAREKFHMPRLDNSSAGCVIVYHDAAWGNALSEEEAIQKMAQGEKVHSQAGYLVYMCERQVAEGEPGKAILVDWSHALPRVARSTFAAEAQSCTEAFDAAELVRATIVEMMCVDLDIANREMLASIPDSGKLLQEKRLFVDLAWLREAMQLGDA
ncbi:unnamed protein product, partial [Prorocentrum cordatum]